MTHPTTSTDAPSDRRAAQRVCLDFEREFPTVSVRAAVRLAHAGRISWQQCEELFRVALADGLAAVTV